MKKIFATLMGVACAASAFAQYLIYDYNVSFKHAQVNYTKISYSFDEYDGKAKDWTGYFDSFKTASDKLTGMVIIPACVECTGEWDEFGSAVITPNTATDGDSFVITDKDEFAVAYITRKGDNISKNPYWERSIKEARAENLIGEDVIVAKPSKLVWKLKVNIDAAMFGKGAGCRLAEGNPCAPHLSDSIVADGAHPTSLKALDDAWMVLTYDVNKAYLYQANEGFIFYPPVSGLKIVTGDDEDCVTTPVTYGLLGYQYKQGSISNAGFGTITKNTSGSTVGFCGGEAGYSCFALKSISGSTVGMFEIGFFCEQPPMFDICNLLPMAYSPISGTFTFKLNSSNSKKYGTDFETACEFVENKYKVVYPDGEDEEGNPAIGNLVNEYDAE